MNDLEDKIRNNQDILKELIKEGETFIFNYHSVPEIDPLFGPRYITISQVDNPAKYKEWRACIERFIKSFYPEELAVFSELINSRKNSNHDKILTKLRAILRFPNLNTTHKMFDNTGYTNLIVNNTNHQTQSQQMVVDIFLKSIKEELTGKELKEIKELLEEYKNTPEETKPRIIDKLKSFGGDVLSNIIANIITNSNLLNNL